MWCRSQPAEPTHQKEKPGDHPADSAVYHTVEAGEHGADRTADTPADASTDQDTKYQKPLLTDHDHLHLGLLGGRIVFEIFKFVNNKKL